jgi:hypothetical protein
MKERENLLMFSATMLTLLPDARYGFPSGERSDLIGRKQRRTYNCSWRCHVRFPYPSIRLILIILHLADNEVLSTPAQSILSALVASSTSHPSSKSLRRWNRRDSILRTGFSYLIDVILCSMSIRSVMG